MKTDLIGESVDRDSKRSCKSEIAQLQLSFPIDQKILRLQVSMKHSVRMAVRGALQELIHE